MNYLLERRHGMLHTHRYCEITIRIYTCYHMFMYIQAVLHISTYLSHSLANIFTKQDQISIHLLFPIESTTVQSRIPTKSGDFGIFYLS